MKIMCEKCKKRLMVPGALVFSPPRYLFGGSACSACTTIRKTHICKTCYLKMLKWIYGKVAVIAGVLCICASVCATEDWSSDYLTVDSSLVADLQIDCTYVIYADDRASLLREVPIPAGQSVTICLDDRSLVYKEWPKGTIYGGNGRWFLKYKNNHGYMDLWRLK